MPYEKSYAKAVKKLYEKDNWENLPNQTTPIKAEALDILEAGIDANDTRIVEIGNRLESIFQQGKVAQKADISNSSISIGDETLTVERICGCIKFSDGYFYIMYIVGYHSVVIGKTLDFVNMEYYYPSESMKNQSYEIFSHNKDNAKMIYLVNGVMYICLYTGLYYSTNGVDWNAAYYTSDSDNVLITNVTGVTSDDSQIIVFGFNNKIYTKALDSSGNFEMKSIQTSGFMSMAMNGTISVAKNTGWGLFYSEDFENYNYLSLSYDGSTYTQSVLYGNGIFITFMGTDLFVSSDGINWEKTYSKVDSVIHFIVFCDNVFYFIATDDNASYLCFTADGKEVREKKIDSFVENKSTASSYYYLPYISYTDGKMFVAPYDGYKIKVLALNESSLEIPYDSVTEKPRINSVELSGDKSFEDLGLTPLTNTEILAIINKIS